MPNWCVTSYVIEGDSKEVQDLFHKLNGLIETEASLKKNDLGACPLSKVVEIFGRKPEKVSCRNELMNLEIDRKGNCLSFITETAWNDSPEVWELVTSRYKSLSYYYQAEESGMEYYVTNDSEGNHFPERFIADTWLYGLRYYNNIDGISKHFEEITSVSVSGIEQLEDKACDFNCNDEDKFFYIHKFEIINTSEDETVKSFLSQQPSHKFQN